MQSQSHTRTIIAAGLAVAALCIAFALGARHGSAQLAQVEQRLAALERGHRTLQDTFLDGSRERRHQLATSLGYRAIPSNAPTGVEHGGGIASGAGAPAFSPEQAQQAMLQTYEQMLQSFAAEPVNAAWAGNVQLNLRDALQGLSQQGLPVPGESQIDCRSTSCMVSLDLGETGEIDGWIEQFLTEIAGDLPQARMVQLPSADGRRTTLHILAGKGQAPPGPPPRG